MIPYQKTPVNEMTAPSVKIQQAEATYQGTILFENLDLTLAANKWSCLLGPSGVGKSTLLHLIAGLITPPAKMSLTVSNQLPLAEQIAYMAQTDLLLPWLNVFENATLTCRLTSYSENKRKQLEERARYLLNEVGLHAALQKYPYQLSGGMRQRTALVRTLLTDKPIILMDEPFSALDAITRFKLQNLAVNLLKNKTVLFVTHDPLESLRLANEIYVLSGQPAVLQTPLLLDENTPREINSPHLIALQEKLLTTLTLANEDKL